MKIGLAGVFASAILLGVLTLTVQSQGVCYTSRITYSRSSRNVYRGAYRGTGYSVACGFLWTRRCRRYRLASFAQLYTSYFRVTSYYSESNCCPGYTGVAPSSCQAVCSGGCQNGGTCISPDVCRCAPGWTGNNCEQDINECNGDHECDHNCNNTAGSFVCSCDDGYLLQDDNWTCIDINECQTDNGGCTQTCDNTDGSYQCSCWDGYELTSDSHNCTDIGECLIGTHNCSQLCLELTGGFVCNCTSGYELQEDGVMCEDIDECSQGTTGCNQGCNNTEGSFNCTCDDGYQLHHDDLTLCVDINECVESNGGCQDICENINGSYSCNCHAGYVLGENQHSCDDIDECANSNGECQHNCTNTDGSYYCTCVDSASYTLSDDGHSCIDVDECADSNGKCEHKCTNTKGSYYCSCEDGYIINGDKRTCYVIKEVTSASEGNKKSSSTLPIASGIGFIFVVVVVIVIIFVIIIVVRRKRRRSRKISSLVAAQATTKTISQSEIEMKTEETIENAHYAQTPAAITAQTPQENIYEVPDQPTDTSENSSNPYENPLVTKANPTYNNPTYDEPKVKKTSTSSLSFVHRKESKSRYERLSSVEEPGDDP